MKMSNSIHNNSWPRNQMLRTSNVILAFAEQFFAFLAAYFAAET